jgi:hypothetical protein
MGVDSCGNEDLKFCQFVKLWKCRHTLPTQKGKVSSQWVLQTFLNKANVHNCDCEKLESRGLGKAFPLL